MDDDLKVGDREMMIAILNTVIAIGERLTGEKITVQVQMNCGRYIKTCGSYGAVSFSQNPEAAEATADPPAGPFPKAP